MAAVGQQESRVDRVTQVCGLRLVTTPLNQTLQGFPSKTSLIFYTGIEGLGSLELTTPTTSDVSDLFKEA